MWRVGVPAWLALVCAVIAASAGAQTSPAIRELRLAVEPLLARSGILPRLVEPFETHRGVRVVVQALPGKEALELGSRGGVDVVWVNAPRAEVQYLNQGFYVDRRLVLYTDQVLLGPPADPARVRGSRDILTAFRHIAKQRAVFISHGERAPGYALEQEIWKRARVTPETSWYVRADSARDAIGMAASRGGYVLADRSSADAAVAQGGVRIVLEGMRPLRRGYYVMTVNPNRFAGVNAADGKAFVDYLISPPAQDVIRALGAGDDRRPDFLPGAGQRDFDS